MVNIIIRYDTNIQHVIHSFPSLLPLSQKCRINILLKITMYVLKSSLLLQNFPTQTVWGPAKCETNQVAFWSWGIGSINIVPSKSALSADNFVIQHQRWANTVLRTEYEYEYYLSSKKWPNTNTNIIRASKTDRIRIRILFGLPKMTEYEYEYY